MAEARRCVAKALARTVRFDADIFDEEALARVIALKRAWYAATGADDYFSKPHRIDLMDRLLHTRDPVFAGMLAIPHVGDHLVAAQRPVAQTVWSFMDFGLVRRGGAVFTVRM